MSDNSAHLERLKAIKRGLKLGYRIHPSAPSQRAQCCEYCGTGLRIENGKCVNCGAPSKTATLLKLLPPKAIPTVWVRK